MTQTNRISKATMAVSGFDLFSGAVKSVQRGRTTMSALTLNVDIESVNVDMSIVKLTVSSGQYSRTSEDYLHVRGSLTSNTALSLARTAGSSTYQAIVDWEVIEFSNLKSLQKGIETLSGVQSVNTAIEEVDLSKSALFFSYSSTPPNTTAMGASASMSAYLTSSKMIQFNNRVNVSDIGRTINWYVVEFN